MTTQTPRKSLVQASGGCLIIAVLSVIMGLIIGEYGVAFYVAAAAALVLSFIIFYFARKYPEGNVPKQPQEQAAVQEEPPKE